MKRIVPVILAIALVPCASGGQVNRAIVAADSLVANAIGKVTPGAVLLVAKDGRIIHERAFGYAALNDYEMHRLANPVAMKTTTLPLHEFYYIVEV